MRRPDGQQEHIATIYRQDLGASTATACVCQGDTHEELKVWGTEIKSTLHTLQEQMCPGVAITSSKLIVKLTGPSMPNLSLCDLPGLRFDGTDSNIRNLVIGQVQSRNAVILAVSPCNVDCAGWAGAGLANDVDRDASRTIGVMTNVDMVFGPVAATRQQNQLWRRQIKDVLEESNGDIPYFATYNPPPGEEVTEATKGEMIAAFGGADKVGIDKLAAVLETKLQEHLGSTLPEMLTNIIHKHNQLEADLKKGLERSWDSVETLVVTYGRFVQGFATGKPPQDAEMKDSESWSRLHTFKTTFVEKLDSFKRSFEADSVYNHPLAQKGILCRSTPDIMTRAEPSKSSLRCFLNASILLV
jgi:hypothetical protein